MLDTGCGTSVVSERLIRKLGLKILPVDEGQATSLIAANGNVLPVIGKQLLTLKIGGMSIPYEFLIVSKLTQDLILGIDFLTDTKAVIYCSDNTVCFFYDMISVNMLHKCKQIAAILSTDVKLEPRTETVVNVRLSAEIKNRCVLLEPWQIRDNQKFMVARTLIEPNGRNSVCRILNPTNQVVVLKRGLPVAFAQDIEINSITQYNTADNSIQHSTQSLHTSKQTNDQSQITNSSKDDTKILENLGLTVTSTNLTKEQLQQLIDLLEKNGDVFSQGLHDLPGTTLLHYHIDTGESAPIRQRPYRPSPQAREEIARQTQEMLDYGIISPSNSAWGSPCVLVKKKDGTYRFCIDYRKLNAVTKPMSWPLPLLTDVWDTLSQNHSSIFSSLDMRSGYFQVPLSEESKEKTTFVVQDGAYAFNRLPFGCRNGPAIYQMLMNQVFRGMTFKNLIVYIDDLLTFLPNFESHLVTLQDVFNRLRDAGLKLHPKKCKFAQSEVLYLGHKISGEGIRVDESKVAVVKNWPVPRSLKDLRGFLGYCNYYRKFVKGFASIAGPLHNLLRKDTSFHWNDKCQDAFEKLRVAMTTTPVLAFADMSKPFILTTDASSESIGYILSQIGTDGKEHPISFSGRSLRNAERRWSVTEIEGLALVEGIKENYAFLFNSPFTVYTDHVSLKWLKSIKNVHGRLFRWSLLLQGLDFTVVHKSGKSNQNADALSRRQYPSTKDEDVSVDDSFQLNTATDCVTNSIECPVSSVQSLCERVIDNPKVRQYQNDEPDKATDSDADIDSTDKEYAIAHFKYNKSNDQAKSGSDNTNLACLESVVNQENVKEMQNGCPDIDRIKAYLQNGELPQDAKLARQTVFESEQYFFRNDGALCHHYSPRNKNVNQKQPVTEQLVIPTSMRTKVLYQFHDLCGHNGHDRTYATIRSRYFWPQLYRDVRSYCKTCRVCQQIRHDTHPRKAPLKPWPVAKICSRWHVDILGPIGKTREGFRYILLCVESLSRWPEAHPLRTQEAVEVADVLYSQVFCRFGIPEVIMTDRGTQFLSRVVTRLCELFKVKRARTSGYRPQSNAAAENFNRVIWKCLKAYCKDQENWNDYLQSIMFAYRSSVSCYSTQYSPHLVMMGREMRLPLDVALDSFDLEGTATVDEYMRKILPKVKMIHEVVKANVEENQERYKERYDRNATDTDYAPGTLVWLLTPPKTEKGKSKKLQIKYSKLVYIKCKCSNNTYIVIDQKTNKEIDHPVHSDRLKLFHSEFDAFPDRVTEDELDTSVGNEESADTELLNKEGLRSKCATENKSEEKESKSVASTPDDMVWHDAEKLLGVKLQNGRRYYKVKWTDGSKPSFEHEDDVSEFLKREYHKTHTLSGSKRKNVKKK